MILVGEFSVPRGILTPFNHDHWNHRRALRYGAFSAGNFRARLEELGLRWEEAFNLCPPGEWNDSTAERVAKEAIAFYHPETKLILVGRRVAASFALKPHFFEIQDRFLVIPHPTQKRYWEDLKRIHAKEIFLSFACL